MEASNCMKVQRTLVDSQSSNTGSIPVSATKQSGVGRNSPGLLWKSRGMAVILQFFISNRARESLDHSSAG